MIRVTVRGTVTAEGLGAAGVAVFPRREHVVPGDRDPLRLLVQSSIVMLSLRAGWVFWAVITIHLAAM